MTKKNIPWPTDRKFWLTHTSDEIATKFNIHRNTVARYRKAHKLPTPPRRGGPGRPPRIDRTRIKLDRTAAWNALNAKNTKGQKVECSENWMFQLIGAMRRAQEVETQRKQSVAKHGGDEEWV